MDTNKLEQKIKELKIDLEDAMLSSYLKHRGISVTQTRESCMWFINTSEQLNCAIGAMVELIKSIEERG